ncbi:EAL domain-containing protein [Noviherbaspirillum aridicola]|uniref:Diguanylate cyclase (GGDEF)-like protein n=1 Tax=Noviherbaspirillum aridicola TaxID=2849687 RepID=A0ABQ4Q3J9_9BURK|nr:EAL domain-containing protein [Noviherbaspirillum aridicola]GIZ51577.1 hypothetical protein NCCP691_15910 [Noviherbaspirillum aridicola]
MDRPIASLDRANRVLRMLSLINRAIVRGDSPDELFRDACRIAVDCGMFKFAWIGLVDTANDTIRLLTGYGDPSGPEDRLVAAGGLADLVRRSGSPCIFNDLMTVPQAVGCEELMRRGFRAMAGLPLCEGDRAIGVFVLYTDDTECFDDTVIGLLHEVVDDIAHALQHMHEEQRRLATESRLYYLAFYDPQTGLPNRALLDERLPLLARAGSLALFDIRLQRLDKAVQIYGRLSTDEVLRAVAARLDRLRTNESFVAHLAQDEFVLAVPGMRDPQAIESQAQRLLQALQAPVDIGQGEVFLHPSIGAACYPLHEADLGHLLRRARVAARRDNAEAGVRIYSASLDHGLETRLQMEADLHRALEREEFLLFYQPQLSLRTGTVVGVEALLQWRHPQRGIVAPGEFVPVLEDCGLMPAVGAWVLRSACMQAGEWQRQGLPPVRVGVNVSALQFRLSDLVKLVRDALGESGMNPALLELELTESLILENVDQTIEAMHQLKAMGLALSLDDFGTGYSSLGYLRRYPVDRIKIDRSFIVDMGAHAGSAALVRSILSMAANLGLRTIAEGVETFEQFNYLRKQRCDEMQGYLFSPAVAPAEIAQMIARGSGLATLSGAGAARQTLLLAGGDAGMLRQMQRSLQNEHWAILCAASAEEAMRLLACHDVGVVVAAPELPDRSAGDFLERVRDMYPETARILVCAHADFHALADAVNRGGVFRVLRAPADPAVLARLVDEGFFHANRGTGGPPQGGRQAAGRP